MNREKGEEFNFAKNVLANLIFEQCLQKWTSILYSPKIIMNPRMLLLIILVWRKYNIFIIHFLIHPLSIVWSILSVTWCALQSYVFRQGVFSNPLLMENSYCIPHTLPTRLQYVWQRGYLKGSLYAINYVTITFYKNLWRHFFSRFLRNKNYWTKLNSELMCLRALSP